MPSHDRPLMTAADTLYSVRTDTGLGGLVVGREAADKLVTVLGSRPDVLTVTATPLPQIDRYELACVMQDAADKVRDGFGADWLSINPVRRRTLLHHTRDAAMERWLAAEWERRGGSQRSLAETLAFLGHGEQL